MCVCVLGGGGVTGVDGELKATAGCFVSSFQFRFVKICSTLTHTKSSSIFSVDLDETGNGENGHPFFPVELDKTGIGENNDQFSLLILRKRKLAKMIISFCFVLFFLLSVLILTKLELSKMIISFLC